MFHKKPGAVYQPQTNTADREDTTPDEAQHRNEDINDSKVHSNSRQLQLQREDEEPLLNNSSTGAPVLRHYGT